MIEYLEKLIAEKNFRKALEVAERMLGEGRREPKELLLINSSIFQARLKLGEYQGAAQVGPMVKVLARGLEEWDVYGATCVNLSATYHDLNRHDEAIQLLNEFLGTLTFYGELQKFETHIWYNLGRSFTGSGQHTEAIHAFDQAIRLGSSSGQHYAAHAARHALIEVLLQVPDLNRVPRLLAKAAAYLRANPGVSELDESRLFHLRLRAEFSILSNRLLRARCVVAVGLNIARSKPRHLYNYHMILAQIALKAADVPAALGHAMAAKKHAVQCCRHDLEVQATQLGQQLIQMNPKAVGLLFRSLVS